MKEYHIYILKCNDDSYYTGITSSLERRLAAHENGIDPKCYTFLRRPLSLVYVERHSDIWQALHREKQFKRWSRKKKEALIRDKRVLLKKYASCLNESHYLHPSQLSRKMST